jgi:apolipoprotein N-acyltransferase
MNKHKMLLAYSTVSAILFWLSWPSLSFSILLFFAFVPLLLIEHELSANSTINSNRILFRYTFLSFFIWNLLCSYWLWNASAVGLIVAVLLNSSMMSIVFLAYHFVKKRNNFFVGSIFFIGFWISMELLHHHWDFSWPWLSLGNAFAEHTAWVQWYEYTGIFGGSVWVLLTNILVFNAILKIKTKSNLIWKNWKVLLYPFSVLVIPIIISTIIYTNYVEKVNPSNIVIVQPNIDPYTEKFSRLSSEEQLSRLIVLSDSVAKPNTEFFIWPETALQNNLPEETLEANPLIIQSRMFLSKYKNGNILTGADTYKTYASEETPTARKFRTGECCYDAFNTAFLIENNPGIKIYHKSKLVAGVEQMPYPSVLKILEPLAINLGGTFGSLGTQKERTVFYTKSGIGAAPVICYESVYGEYVAEYVKNGAQFIAIVTNDGWWGNTQGYKQHAAYARLRAVETRRSIARSANTGTSCFIDQRGDVYDATSYAVRDAKNGNINLNERITFYVQYGDWFAFSASLLALLLLVYSVLKKKLLSA